MRGRTRDNRLPLHDSFSALFWVHRYFAKFADARECKPSAVYTLAYGWSVLFRSHIRHPVSRSRLSHSFDCVCNCSARSVLLVLLVESCSWLGIRYGKISTSWLVINLSAAIPAIGSVLIYHERIRPRKIAMVALAVVSVILLWKDKRQRKREQQTLAPSKETA